MKKFEARRAVLVFQNVGVTERVGHFPSRYE